MTKKKRPRPIAPKPIQMKSRKKARQITSLFHKLTRQIQHEKSNLKHNNDNNKSNIKECNARIEALEQEIEKMGGREEYQRASQLSTKYHSTSKWVLKVLFQYGWLPHGIPIIMNDDDDGCSNHDSIDSNDDDGGSDNRRNENYTPTPSGLSKKKKSDDKNIQYRTVHILEIGAINVELLNAASKTKRIAMKKADILQQKEQMKKNETREKVEKDEDEHGDQDEETINGEEQQNETNSSTATQYKNVPMYNLHVRAIDLRSSHESIEEADYLSLPPPTSTSSSSRPNTNNKINQNNYYDVIVCSMVLNCVTTDKDRGKMITKIYTELNHDGLCFLTIPKLCLTQSKYMDRKLFEELLVMGVGFEIVNVKETPKVAFWVLKKKKKDMKDEEERQRCDWKKEWSNLRVIHKGKKYRNEFGVVLAKKDCIR